MLEMLTHTGMWVFLSLACMVFIKKYTGNTLHPVAIHWFSKIICNFVQWSDIIKPQCK